MGNWTFVILYFLIIHGISDSLRFKTVILKPGSIINIQSLSTELHQFGFSFKEQIAENLYVFQSKHASTSIDERYLKQIVSSSKGMIEDVEFLNEQRKTVIQDNKLSKKVSYLMDKHHEHILSKRGYTFNTINKYGMGVQDAWAKGYSGTNVVIAITDVGVDIDHPDLKENINTELSYNFVNNNHDVYPEVLLTYPSRFELTDHGTQCSGLIASKKNGMCNAGIAFSGSIAVLKVFEIERGIISYSDASILKALTFRNQEIDVYSNSWMRSTPFQPLTFSLKEVLNYGIIKGRAGKGSIFVFPVGEEGDGLTNSINTITVGALGMHGSNTSSHELCACTLTSALGEGSNLNSSYMTTASHRNKCSSDFRGLLASTSMVSAIIALALQANPNLSWRDVQHLLVESSSHRNLNESNAFKSNGAGKFYHSRFGFGLINASTFTSMAKIWSNVDPQVSQTETASYSRKKTRNKTGKTTSTATVCFGCQDSQTLNRNIYKIEHVVVKISFVSLPNHHLHIYIVSPSKTVSVLVNKKNFSLKEKLHNNVEFLSVHFWGETANGLWKLHLSQYGNQQLAGQYRRFGILAFSLTISGLVENVGTSMNDSNINFQNTVRLHSQEMTTSDKFIKRIVLFVLGLFLGLAFVCICAIAYLKIHCSKNYLVLFDDFPHI